MADAIGYPVAVKAEHRHLGRSVRAGVGLDLAGPDDVTAAVKEMQEAIGADADVVLVQSMVAPGLDLRIRSATDEQLGPLVAIGLGSSTADLVSDEASRLAPLSSVERGRRWSPAPAPGRRWSTAGLAVEPVVDMLMRVAQLVSDHPRDHRRRPQPDHRLRRRRRRHRRHHPHRPRPPHPRPPPPPGMRASQAFSGVTDGTDSSRELEHSDGTGLSP